MYCDNKSMYEEPLHRAKLPTLYTQCQQTIAIIMYKVKMAWRLPTLRTYLLLPILSIILSYLDFRRVAYSKHSLTYLGPVVCSKLNTYIQSSESLGTFKKCNFQFHKPAGQHL